MTVQASSQPNSFVQSEQNEFHTRFAVEFDGVRIPKNGNSNIEVHGKPEVVRIQREFSQLQSELRKSVEEVAWGEDSIQNAITLRQAIESYTRVSERLSVMLQGWRGLVDRITEIEGVEVGEFATDETKRQLQMESQMWRNEIRSGIQPSAESTENSVTARHASLPLSEFKEKLEMDIAEKHQSFCSDVLQQLIRLVDLEVIAFIEWYDEHACTYQRYTRKFEVVQDGQSSDQFDTRVVNKRWRTTKTTRTTGTTTRKLCRHIQHLVKANIFLPGNSKVLIPREQKALLDSLPAWLAPSIRIVEGMLIRETLIEQDLGVQIWEEKNDEVQWQSDPAIILGPFVLSAWGPAEIQNEINNQEREEATRRESLEPTNTRDARRMSPFKVAGIGTLTGAEVLLLQFKTMPIGFSVGVFLTIAAAVLLAFPWGVNQTMPPLPNRTRANQIAACYAIGMVICIAIASVALSLNHFGVTLLFLAAGGYLLFRYENVTLAWDRLSK